MQTLVLKEPIIAGSTITLPYAVDDLRVNYVVTAPAPLDQTEHVAILARWLSLYFVVGLLKVSYFQDVRTEYSLADIEVNFFQKLYYHGMAEFRICNHLPVDLAITITPRSFDETSISGCTASTVSTFDNTLVFNGGGKDGLTTATVLTQTGIQFDWLHVGRISYHSNGAQAKALHAFPGLKAWAIARSNDMSDEVRTLIGHTPLNAGLAIMGALSATILNKQYLVGSNELSANEGNGVFDGIEVNHQYSKSLEFENDFRALLRYRAIPVTYFSFLRPLHELQIMRIFSRFEPLHSMFSSCNQGLLTGTWCLQCPKCAFVTLSLAAFNPRSARREWGERFLDSPEMIKHIKELVDPNSMKPFDCVGTLEECRIVLRLALDQTELTLSENFRSVLAKYAEGITAEEVTAFLSAPLARYNIPGAFSTAFTKLQELATYSVLR